MNYILSFPTATAGAAGCWGIMRFRFSERVHQLEDPSLQARLGHSPFGVNAGVGVELGDRDDTR